MSLSPEQFFEAYPTSLLTPLELLGSGGDQLVFKHPDDPELVIKVSHSRLVESIEADRGCLVPSHPENVSNLNYEVLTLKARIAELYEYFDATNIASETARFLNLPLNGRTCRLLSDKHSGNDAEMRWFPTIVRVQKHQAALTQPEVYHTHDFVVGKAEEKTTLDPQSYGSICRRWLALHEQNSDAANDVQAFLDIEGNDSLQAILTLCADRNFRDNLADFTARAIRYCNASGEVIDIAGRNNVVFFIDPADGGWTYRLIDTLHQPSEPLLYHARKGLSKYRAGTTTRFEYMAILNVLGAARSLNFFAELLGLEERLSLGDNLPESDAAWLDIARKARAAISPAPWRNT